MATLGEMGNISNLYQVGWHEWACFREGISHTMPQPNEKLGRYLGPANNERNDMLRWMLQQKMVTSTNRTLRGLAQKKYYCQCADVKLMMGDSVKGINGPT